MEQLSSAENDARIIDPSYYDDGGDGDYGQISHGGETFAGLHMPWEAWARCLFILMMLALVCLLTWRPSMGRLYLLFSLVSPSRGERLEWRAIDDPVPLPPPVKRTPLPAEWRLSPGNSSHWTLPRPQAGLPAIAGGRVAPHTWTRITDNAWSWWDDAVRLRRGEANGIQPPQKSMTAVRVGDIAVWPTPTPTQARTAPPASGWAAESPMSDAGSPFFTAPNLPDVPRTVREEPPALVQEVAAAPALDIQEGASLFPSLSALPPLPASNETAHEPLLATRSAPLSPAPAQPVAGGGVPAAPIEAIEEIDWKNREITGPIKDAYLIIYPKLRFIGLCVPGQGYIRKYNQVGVPRELEGVKMRGDDGHVPYGRYYIADRNLDADGPRLFLSWPSPEDAKRIGLSDSEQHKVENAWKRESLPPQDTTAGGGVGLNGLRQWVELTDGGFSLEAPHMEEIFTALPDKAKVLIQP